VVGRIITLLPPDSVGEEALAGDHGPVRLVLCVNWNKLDTVSGQDMTA